MIFEVSTLAGAAIFFCGCLFIYLQIMEESRSRQPPESDRSRPFRCPICTYIYAVDKRDDLSSCPRCGTINKKEEA